MVALAGALVATTPAVAPQITSAFQTLICRVGGGSCAGLAPHRAAPAGAAACSRAAADRAGRSRSRGARLRRVVAVAR